MFGRGREGGREERGLHRGFGNARLGPFSLSLSPVSPRPRPRFLRRRHCCHRYGSIVEFFSRPYLLFSFSFCSAFVFLWRGVPGEGGSFFSPFGCAQSNVPYRLYRLQIQKLRLAKSVVFVLFVLPLVVPLFVLFARKGLSSFFRGRKLAGAAACTGSIPEGDSSFWVLAGSLEIYSVFPQLGEDSAVSTLNLVFLF